MLVDGKNRNAYDRALMLTPVQDRTSGSCLHFWYFMHVASFTMQLNVYAYPQSLSIWAFGGTFSDSWLYAQVNINSPNQPWQGVFEGLVLGQNTNGSIAIDDVSITRGLCPKPGDCTFESDLCGWRNSDIDADMDWIVGNGVHSFGTGPQFGMREIYIRFTFLFHMSCLCFSCALLLKIIQPIQHRENI